MDEIPPSPNFSDDNFLETFWDALLSRRPDQIRAAFQTLDAASQRAVLAHLARMVSEDGWQPEQILSAQAALNALNAP